MNEKYIIQYNGLFSGIAYFTPPEDKKGIDKYYELIKSHSHLFRLSATWKIKTKPGY